MAEAATASTESASGPPRLLLFDGVCGFCDATVSWLIDHDPSGRFHFATLQGETAAALRSRHPGIPEALETMVYVESQNGAERIFLNSEAALRVCAELGGGWAWLAKLRVLPRALTDFFYFLVVRNRYRLWGRRDSCRVPGPDERARFLE